MLALTRKKDEAIIIGGNIEIKVLEIQDGKVRLGIIAPKELGIYREEIYLDLEKNNKTAARIGNKNVIENLSKLF